MWELHNLALESTGIHLGNGRGNGELKTIEAVYLDSGGEFLVGELEGRIVAMGALKPVAEGVAAVKRMRVHPDFQRRGFGQQILSALETRARSLGVRRLVLDTSTLQLAAQTLYQKNGYRETGRRKLRRFEMIDYEKVLV